MLLGLLLDDVDVLLRLLFGFQDDLLQLAFTCQEQINFRDMKKRKEKTTEYTASVLSRSDTKSSIRSDTGYLAKSHGVYWKSGQIFGHIPDIRSNPSK